MVYIYIPTFNFLVYLQNWIEMHKTIRLMMKFDKLNDMYKIRNEVIRIFFSSFIWFTNFINQNNLRDLCNDEEYRIFDFLFWN